MDLCCLIAKLQMKCNPVYLPSLYPSTCPHNALESHFRACFYDVMSKPAGGSDRTFAKRNNRIADVADYQLVTISNG